MVRLLHIADLHLGWTPQLPGQLAEIRRRERDAVLDSAIDFALNPSNRIDIVVVAGDLFESHRPDASLVERAVRGLARLCAAGLHVLTVPGNHDEISYHDSVYRVRAKSWPGLLVRDPVPRLAARIEVRGMPVHLYSAAYTGGITPAEPVRSLPREPAAGLHVGVFHASLDARTAGRSLHLTTRALADAGYDYVALGHIHAHETATLGTSLAAYAGAIEHKGFSDPGVGHLLVAELDGRGVRLERPPVAVRRHIVSEVDISALASQDDLERACRRLADREALARITLVGSASFRPDPDRLRAALEGDFLYVEVGNQADLAHPDLVAAHASEPTIRGLFVRRLATRIAEARDDRERRVAAIALQRGFAALEEGGGQR